MKHIRHSKFIRMICLLMSWLKLVLSPNNLNPFWLVYNMLQLGLFLG